ncbi:hypothetical protein NG819_10575 [Pseudarthrobacter sp. Fe7]|nr:hypothetical protein NG819_10575 [Pseudarthrobacter sp. Fe7]
MQALFRSPHGDGSQASFALAQLLLGGLGRVLDEGQPLLGLHDVVRNLGQRTVGILGPHGGQGLLRANDLGVSLGGPGADGCEGLGSILFQFTQGIEVRLLLLEGCKGGLGAADDLAQPGPLLLLGVWNVVIEPAAAT